MADFRPELDDMMVGRAFRALEAREYDNAFEFVSAVLGLNAQHVGAKKVVDDIVRRFRADRDVQNWARGLSGGSGLSQRQTDYLANQLGAYYAPEGGGLSKEGRLNMLRLARAYARSRRWYSRLMFWK